MALEANRGRWWAALWTTMTAAAGGEVGIRAYFPDDAYAGEIRLGVVMAGAIVGIVLGGKLWWAAVDRSWLRSAAWGLLGSWLTVQVAAVGVVIVREGMAAPPWQMLPGIGFVALMITMLGGWLIAIAGVSAGLLFLVVTAMLGRWRPASTAEVEKGLTADL